MLGSQRLRQFLYVAVHDGVDPIQREVDAVIGDAPLREVVGADALAAIARPDQALARARLRPLLVAAPAYL
jgi:hypothetical protein